MSSLTKSKQVPPNIRHTRGQNKYPLPIKERQDDYLRALNHEQTRQYSTGSVPSTSTSNPHDMNKQSVLSSQSQLIPNLYGSVSSQHPQSSMPGPNHGSTTLVQQPSQSQLQGRGQPQTNMQTYFAGRSNASANYGISRTAGMTVATSANAPYSGQLTNSMMYQSQNPYGSHVTPSPAMIIPSLYSQNQYTAPQYAAQPMLYRSSGATPYYNTSGTVYFSSVNMGVPRTNMNSLGGTTAASAPPKRERKIITITDESGRDLTNEIISTAKNDMGSSSNTSGSQMNSNEHGHTNSVAAQFAEQVAAAVKGHSRTPPLIPVSHSGNKVQPDAVQLEEFGVAAQQFGSSMKTTVLESDESGSKTPPPLISPSQISNCVEVKPPLQQEELGSVPSDKAETLSNSSHIDSHNSSSFKVIDKSIESDVGLPLSNESNSSETEGSDKTKAEKLENFNVQEISTEIDVLESRNVKEVVSERYKVDEKSTEGNVPESRNVKEVVSERYTVDEKSTQRNISESRSMKEVASERHQADEKNETDSIPSHHLETEPLNILAQTTFDSDINMEGASLSLSESKEMECSDVTTDEKENLSEKEIITSTSEIHNSVLNKIDVNEENKENASEVKQEGKEKKGKGKKRGKEPNKRGESKESDDMAAFIDRCDGVNQTVSTTLSPTSTSPIPEVVFTSTRMESEIASLEEEERKVAAKNEENKRVSREIENSVDEKDAELISNKSNSLLKYNYSEDQWSPINQEGKRKYDRAFLLNMQGDPLCLQKPKNLPDVEIVKEKALLQRLPDTRASAPQISSRPDPFMPNFARSARPPPGGVNRRHSQQGKEKPKKVISIPGSLNQDVKLHASENAWKAGTSNKKNATEDPEEAETKDLYKKVTGILNKLTPQKFHTLVEQVKHLNIDTEARLRGVMDLVFEKAVDEPNFSVPYANMCKQIALIKVPKADQSGNEKDKDVNFKKLLLMKCQREFERDSTDESKNAEKLAQIEKAENEEMKKQLREELEEEERKSRHRSLGNIKFIGELFKLNMLTAPIMHECIRKLLRQGDEDSLECLCRLLTTIGKELDSKPRNSSGVFVMDNYFEAMQTIVSEKKTSPRVRFMLQDVIELKHNNWVPRRDENNPKTIDQIHREAEREAQQQQQLLQQTTFPKRPNDDRNAQRKNRNSPSFMDEGWSMHSNKSKAATTIDPSKLKLSKVAGVDAGNVHLGHAFSKWGQGSSGGQAKASKQENDTKSAVFSSNRYSALVDQNPPNYEPRRGSQRSAASSRESSRSGASNLPPPPVRKTSSQTSSKERKQVIDAVKEIARPDIQKQRHQNNVQSQLSPKETGVVLQGMELSEEEMISKTKPLIDEFMHNNDFKEAIQCVVETVCLSTAPVFVSAAISQVLERSSQGRRLVGQLMHQLVKKKIIPAELYVAGLKSVLETADDCAIDVPKIWQYLGELIEPMIQDNTISLSFLKDAAEPCLASGTGGKLVSEVLHAATKNQGSIRVAELWKEAGLQWVDFLPETENVTEFVKRNNLEFTISEIKIENPSEELSIDAIKTELDHLLQRRADNEEIFDWIAAHVRGREKNPKFIRALATSLVESAIEGDVSISSFDREKLLPLVPLLHKYVDQNVDLELQVVFALQALVNRLEHPKGLLKELFEFFFDEDLISEEAITQWEQNNDPAEQEGKGVALKSVTSFITWIREQEDDSLDDN